MNDEYKAHFDEEYAYPDNPDMKPDFTVAQYYERYTEEDHAVWRDLLARQMDILKGRACEEFIDALSHFEFPKDRIPRFEELNAVLEKVTGWKIVAVPGLIPSKDFFTHFTKKQFPVTHWIRPRAKFDYIVEPDLFHDLFGHVPLLVNPVFSNYMVEYGKGALRAMQLGGEKHGGDYLKMLTTLYWFTVEFGLIQNKDGIRIYGAGIVSSKGESIYCLESPEANRIRFNLKRVMKTEYEIDKFQPTYFVIDSFEQLFADTFQDFKPVYEEICETKWIPVKSVDNSDVFYNRAAN